MGDLFVSVYNDQQHFAYRDANGNIQDVWYGTGGWKLQQINNANGHGGSVAGDTYIACPQATAAAVGDLFVSVYNDQQHFAYRDANGNIQDVWYGTGGWKLQQINNANGHGGSVAGDTYIACPQATAAAVGDLFVSVYNDQQHFAYRDANGNIQDVWYGTGGWKLQQINNAERARRLR